MGKRPCLRLTLRQRQNPYLILSVRVQGFACPCFTNVPVQCNTISTSDVCLNVCLLPSSSLSFVYYIVYIAPFSLSIVKDHRGVSSTSFKYLFQPAAESCICYKGVFLPSTLKPGPYGPLTVGRQEPLNQAPTAP